MLCEMCGKEVESTARTRIEGSVLSLCPNCSRFGVALTPTPAAPRVDEDATPAPSRAPLRPRSTAERDLFAELPEMELAEDWYKRIRTAREGRSWTPEELGKKLNEKKSVVLKIESGSFRPPDVMIRKIEQLLKVRLRAPSGEAAPSGRPGMTPGA